MRAMILAAGRGGRLGSVTDNCPKPLVKVQGKALIEHRLLALAKAGIKEVVINVSYLAQQIQEALGDGSCYGLRIAYSFEPERLETGGGIKQALPLLGEEPFLLTNADLLTDFDYQTLLAQPVDLAHLVLVNNPAHVPEGDFSLQEGLVTVKQEATYTYSGIALLRAKLFKNEMANCFPLTQVLAPAIADDRVTGQVFAGQWADIGRKEELALYD